MEAAALVYMPKSCIYMPEPSSGDHYTLLPLARDKNICLVTLSMFTAAQVDSGIQIQHQNYGGSSEAPS